LVALGNHLQDGIDYHETFTPVVNSPTIRLILSLALTFGWPIRELDVKNAFLHGTLIEEVYMRQPLGCVHPHYPSHMCKLKKAIYGLNRLLGHGSVNLAVSFCLMISFVLPLTSLCLSTIMELLL